MVIEFKAANAKLNKIDKTIWIQIMWLYYYTQQVIWILLQIFKQGYGVHLACPCFWWELKFELNLFYLA